ncbi:curli assembly protein CsgF [Flagellatimonas centrodinii]|uniref:curli assembly protein CsgF n=1 Tax=Flagellatimonas centrodinii TaxID=2806210 RepID=UPI001FF7BACB|nr:curli assembly protein CsgF [Flagellatimonas centrodinii]ULQ47362.1 curli assembly protein CsgF [Flagellatimonas centrodinii]
MKPRIPTLRGLTSITLIAALMPLAQASELIYRPTNPSFGGNPFNSDHLRATAEAQRPRSDRGNGLGLAGSSPADQFVRQLQSRLLSSLATEVNNAIFGDDAAESGTIVFGDQVIEFSRGLEFVSLVIANNATGERTEIQVPLLQVGVAP